MSPVAARVAALLAPLLASAARVACLAWEFAGGAPGARTLNPRIKSLNVASSPEFTGVRVAAQTRRAYPGELRWTVVNCNPNCNHGVHPWQRGRWGRSRSVGNISRSFSTDGGTVLLCSTPI